MYRCVPCLGEASETVNRGFLLKKAELYGIDEVILKLLRSYLTDV